MLVHLDTDIGDNPDDAAALAMLLGWPGVEVTGVTTTVDPGGVRAGYARQLLATAGAREVPVAAGAALDLLSRSVERGATLVAVGPQTNLALLAASRPGALAGAAVVAMGGWVAPLADDLPAWGPERDHNVQSDVTAAAQVADSGADLTLVPLAATLRTHLRERDLPALRAAGPVGEWLAEQAVAFAEVRGHARLARDHAGLPDDLLLFLHDPLACAVALGWPGARVERRRLRAVVADGLLTWVPDDAARPVGVVAEVDGPAFTRRWLAAIQGLGR